MTNYQSSPLLLQDFGRLLLKTSGKGGRKTPQQQQQHWQHKKN